MIFRFALSVLLLANSATADVFCEDALSVATGGLPRESISLEQQSFYEESLRTLFRNANFNTVTPNPSRVNWPAKNISLDLYSRLEYIES